MDSSTIEKFPKSTLSGLTAENIMLDVKNMIIEDPSFKKEWDDFLSSTPANVLISLFANIGQLIASRIDWSVNEGFVGLSTQDTAKYKFLKLLGYVISTPLAAEVPVTITVSGGDLTTFETVVTQGYTNDNKRFSPKTLLAKDNRGNIKNFEIIAFDKENNKYNYFSDVKLVPKLSTDTTDYYKVSAFEGSTVFEDFTSNSEIATTFKLGNFPVVKNSIAVFLLDEDGNIDQTGTGELLEVKSFLEPRAQKAEIGGVRNPYPYVREVAINGEVSLTFGTSSNTFKERRLKKGQKIRVFYRVGGGLNGNITVGSINQRETISVLIGTTSQQYIMSYYNAEQGNKGTDSETIDEAVFRAPREIKTGGRLVTKDDYEVILKNNPNIIKSKSYGQFNLPDDFSDRYGFFPNPMDVWNFVLMKKPNWETLPRNSYPDFEFTTTNLQNHFSKEYAFREGQLGYRMTVYNPFKIGDEVSNIDLGGIQMPLKNYIVYDTPNEFKDNIYNLAVLDQTIIPNLTAANVNAAFKASFSNANITTLDGATKKVKFEDSTLQIVNDAKEFVSGVDLSKIGYMEAREDINAEYKVDITNAYDTNNSFIISLAQGSQLFTIIMDGISSTPISIDLRSSEYNNPLSSNFFVNGQNAYWSAKAGVSARGLVEILNAKAQSLLGGNRSYYIVDKDISSPNSFMEDIEFEPEDTNYGFEITIDDGLTVTTYPIRVSAGYDRRYFALINKMNDAISTIPAIANKLYFSIEENTTTNLWHIYLRSSAEDIISVSMNVTDQNITTTYNGSPSEYRNVFTLSNIVGVTNAIVVGGVGTSSNAALSYANIASIETDTSSGTTRKFFVLRSPVKGKNSKITFVKETNSILANIFNVNFGTLNQVSSYGVKRIIVSTSGTPTIFNGKLTFSQSSTFGKVYYENGSLNPYEKDSFLNYVYKEVDFIKIGDDQRAIRGADEPARLIYNTILTERASSLDPSKTIITVDKGLSEPQIKLTYNRVSASSLFNINGVNIQKTSPAKKDFTISSYLPSVVNWDDVDFVLSIKIDGMNDYYNIVLNETTIGPRGGATLSKDDLFIRVVDYINADVYLNSQIYNQGTSSFVYKNGNTITFQTSDDTNVGRVFFRKYFGSSTDFLRTLMTPQEYLDSLLEIKNYVNGDYKIEWDDDLFQYKMYSSNNPDSLISDGKFYLHYIEDNRLIRRIASERGDDLSSSNLTLYDAFFDRYKKTTDEDELNKYLDPYKIIGISNQFKQPIISLFSIIAEIFISEKIPASQIQNNINTIIKERYNIQNSEIGASISKSEVISEIIKINGVVYANIKYIGTDPLGEYLDAGSNISPDVIKREFVNCKFDEIILLSDDVYTGNRQTAGLIYTIQVLKGK